MHTRVRMQTFIYQAAFIIGDIPAAVWSTTSIHHMQVHRYTYTHTVVIFFCFVFINENLIQLFNIVQEFSALNGSTSFE